MAENRGGYRPTAPQNNPTNVSATGGAGQSGTQPARYMSGLAYGQGQAQMEQQTAAPMAGNPVAATPSAPKPQLQSLMGLMDPTSDSSLPITNGVDSGAGAGSEILSLPSIVPGMNLDSSTQLIKALYQMDPNNADVRRMMEVMSAEGRI
jgi:hypothetical protein